MSRPWWGCIEAAYGEADSDNSWLASVLAAVEPWLNRGQGVIGLFLKQSAVRGVALGDHVASADMAPELVARCLLMDQILPPEIHQKMFVGEAVSTASMRSGLGSALPESPFWKRYQGSLEYRDALGILATDPRGNGCLLAAGLDECMHLPPEFVRRWNQLAAQISAGLRLRGRASSSTPIEAVLSPAGKVLHAEPRARERADRKALSHGTKRMGRARSTLRTTALDEAVALWRALVSGRWSLVDRFDTDDKRFVLAHANAPPVARWAMTTGLSEREERACALAAQGLRNKLIAYHLGLSPSTACTLLTRASKKLRVSSRVALIREWRRQNVGGAATEGGIPA